MRPPFAELRGVARTRTVFFCSACGFESPRWLGRCPSCEAWNTFSEAPAARTKREARAATTSRGPLRLAEIDNAQLTRLSTGLREFDAVLGGGIVPGSLSLIGGPPGAGKSTLLLQIAMNLIRQRVGVVYLCGEESASQIKLRAQRLGAHEDVLVFPETNLRAALDELERIAPQVLIVDSIQTVWLPESESYAGSVAQIRDCAQALMEFSKRGDCATFVVGHVTKDGAIAGPRLLEHLVDTVLYFEGESSGELRIVRAYKNRFGGIDEICVFGMHDDGLHEVSNPSEIFLSSRKQRPSGTCVVAGVLGSRPILIEIQALVGETAYGTPRRLAANLDQARLAMVLAVLERRAGMHLGQHDVYASVAGGLRISEPAADLGIALAIASAFRNVAIADDTAAFGELGLSGEIRNVHAAARRASEARRLGFRTLLCPETQSEIGQAIQAALS